MCGHDGDSLEVPFKNHVSDEGGDLHVGHRRQQNGVLRITQVVPALAGGGPNDRKAVFLRRAKRVCDEVGAGGEC